MSKQHCSQCPEPESAGFERFRFLATEFDVKQAREIISASPREPLEVSYQQLRSLGLALDPEGETLHMGTYVSEEHMAHIPADKVSEPLLIVPLRIYSRKEKNDIKSHILIDGNHRATRLYREGKQVTAYLLTEKEAVSCCVNREPHWWKGVKRPRRAA